MKIKLIVLLSVFIVEFAGAQNAQQGKYFFVKSGHIEYALGGNTTGTKTVWFDDYGMLMYTLTESTTVAKILGIKSKSNEKNLEIRKGDKIWKIDLLKNTGGIIDIEAQTKKGKDMTLGKSDAQLLEMEKKVLTDIGAKIEGYETFLGKKCLKFSLGSTNFLQYKGIPLKSDVPLLGISYTETATSFEMNINVPASKFEIPKNIKLEEAVELPDLSSGLGSLKDLGNILKGEDDQKNSDGLAPGMNYGKFVEATKNLAIPGYRYFMSSNDDQLYLTTYVKSENDQVIIFAEHDSRFDELVVGNESQDVKSKYTLKGRSAAFIHINKEDDGTPVESRMLITRLPLQKTALYVISAKAFTQKQLEDILAQIKL